MMMGLSIENPDVAFDSDGISLMLTVSFGFFPQWHCQPWLQCQMDTVVVTNDCVQVIVSVTTDLQLRLLFDVAVSNFHFQQEFVPMRKLQNISVAILSMYFFCFFGKNLRVGRIFV